MRKDTLHYATKIGKFTHTALGIFLTRTNVLVLNWCSQSLVIELVRRFFPRLHWNYELGGGRLGIKGTRRIKDKGFKQKNGLKKVMAFITLPRAKEKCLEENTSKTWTPLVTENFGKLEKKCLKKSWTCWKMPMKII